MLKLDSSFRESYFEHYGKMTSRKVPIEINIEFGKWKPVDFANVMNIAKTASTLGMTYSEYYTEAVGRVFGLFDPENFNREIFNFAFYHLYLVDPRVLEKFLGLRFAPRDIYRDVAEAAYGHATEENIKHIKNIKTEHTYSIQIPNPESRDKWFYDLSVTVGSYAKCHSRKIGAVLVRDNSVISTGYNGPPRGIPNCDQRWEIDKAFRAKYGPQADGKETKGICPRRVIGFKSGEGLGICPAGHAERNALINAARLGINTKNTKLYMSCGVPCTPCAVEIINAGVEEIICTAVDWYDETTMYLLENSELKIRLYDFMV